MNRKQFVRMVGAGLAGTVLVGFPRIAWGQVGADSAHLRGLHPSNSPQTNRQNLLKALDNPDSHLRFPAGTYRIDNSDPAINVHDFSGTVVFDPDAKWVFTNNANRGIVFSGGTNATFYGLSVAFEALPPARVDAQECIAVKGATGPKFYGLTVEGSAAAGLLFGQCLGPVVEGALIRHTRADGLHFANCQNALASDIVTEDTGDDGVAFLNYAKREDHSGGLATNLIVRKSHARGISVVGQRDVTIENFVVDSTDGPGIYCASESFWDTRTPSNVVFRHGTVSDVGRLVGGNSNEKHGISYNQVTSATFSNIDVVGPTGRGVNGTNTETGGTVYVRAVEVREAGQAGVHAVGGTVDLSDVVVRGSGGTGFAVADTDLLRFGVLTALNTSQRGDLGRAFSFEGNRRVEGTRIEVVDTGPSTGYVVALYGPQTGNLGNVRHHVRSGGFRLVNQSDLRVESIRETNAQQILEF